jgi:hypothetical protein
VAFIAFLSRPSRMASAGDSSSSWGLKPMNQALTAYEESGPPCCGLV